MNQPISITKGEHYEILPDKDFDICSKREKIKKIMLNGFNNFNTFNINDLKILYNFYDKNTFKNELNKMLNAANRTIIFKTNSTKIPGEHTYSKDTKIHTINISTFAIGNLFNKGEKTLRSCGLIIHNRLDGLINVFEHEITHLYCSLKNYTRKIKSGKGKMYYSPHGKLFRELAYRFFGHTEFKHNFNNGEASEQLLRNQCEIGMDVYFVLANGKHLYGKISKLNPTMVRVTIERGTIYNVPYAGIRKSDRNVTVLENNKTKYKVGMIIKFMHKTKPAEGKIIKCNPTRARIQSGYKIYDVPYSLLC